MAETADINHPVPPEPWFYGFLGFCIIVGTVVGIIGVFVAFGIQAFSTTRLDYRDGSGIAVGMLTAAATLIVGLLTVLIWAAVMSVLLDMARNVRIIRYKTRG
jgi:hypothetical protein